jgi:GGDEF domain-containing protein
MIAENPAAIEDVSIAIIAAPETVFVCINLCAIRNRIRYILMGFSPKQIMTAADAALYQAKKSGRDCVVVAEVGVDLTLGVTAQPVGA